MTERELSNHYRTLIVKFRKLQQELWKSPLFRDEFYDGDVKTALREVVKTLSPFTDMIGKIYDPQIGKLAGTRLRQEAYNQLWKRRKKRARKSKKAKS